ncbi:hypothetical protein ACLMAL_22750, partial [Nocardia sp. CWNU-33]|uniref:hypothetical protein n=1 Tax=Nocardia sp. CWNU-33 TaxID=3392117 RepID=UPI00398E3B8B
TPNADTATPVALGVRGADGREDATDAGRQDELAGATGGLRDQGVGPGLRTTGMPADGPLTFETTALVSVTGGSATSWAPEIGEPGR